LNLNLSVRLNQSNIIDAAPHFDEFVLSNAPIDFDFFDTDICESSETSEELTSDSFSSDNSEVEPDFVLTDIDEDNYEDCPIYQSSATRMSQFNLLLTLFITRFSLSKICSEELLKLIIFLWFISC